MLNNLLIRSKDPIMEMTVKYRYHFLGEKMPNTEYRYGTSTVPVPDTNIEYRYPVRIRYAVQVPYLVTIFTTTNLTNRALLYLKYLPVPVPTGTFCIFKRIRKPTQIRMDPGSGSMNFFPDPGIGLFFGGNVLGIFRIFAIFMKLKP
jgi:hypothetical protein